MAFPWLFAALAGGATVADHQLGGHGRAAVVDTIGDAWDAAWGNEPAPGESNSFIRREGEEENNGGGIMDWLGDNMGVVGGLGGIAALWMSPLPDFVKKMGSLALLAMAAISFIKGNMTNNFNSVAEDQPQRHVVMEQGFDADDPNIVGQTGADHVGGPDVTAGVDEELIATAE